MDDALREALREAHRNSPILKEIDDEYQAKLAAIGDRRRFMGSIFDELENAQFEEHKKQDEIIVRLEECRKLWEDLWAGTIEELAEKIRKKNIDYKALLAPAANSSERLDKRFII